MTVMIINFDTKEELIKRYGLPVLKEEVLTKEPVFNKRVALKLYGENVLHRTEKGLVHICNTKEELKKAYGFLGKRKGEVVMQEMGEGLELFCGMKIDKTFGRIFMVGLGGIYVEVLGDISYGIGKIDKKKAKGMIKNLKSYKILKGYRGKKYNIDKLVEFLIKFSDMCETENIREVDINPLFINERGVKIADLKITI